MHRGAVVFASRTMGEGCKRLRTAWHKRFGKIGERSPRTWDGDEPAIRRRCPFAMQDARRGDLDEVVTEIGNKPCLPPCRCPCPAGNDLPVESSPTQSMIVAFKVPGFSFAAAIKRYNPRRELPLQNGEAQSS